MKKLLLISFSLFMICTASAKKVKFAVNMTGQTINTTGVHIWGDFQVMIGDSSDWCPNCTPLTQEAGDTNIYSIVVDLPAFAKYEFAFLNGDQGYDVEFVPVEARVGYDFNSNRWLYVDSLADDTTYVGAVMFSGNAPAGLTLVRFLVNMQNETSFSPDGVHVAGIWQGWDPTTVRMYSFVTGVYEIIQYVTPGTYNYRFYNGNLIGEAETVDAGCSVFGNRETNVSADVILATVCFGGCTDCPVGINEIAEAAAISVSPNPFHDYTTIQLIDNVNSVVTLSDFTGRVIRRYADVPNNQLRIAKNNLASGIYFVSVSNNNRTPATARLVVE